MDALVKQVKELLEESDPDIQVTESVESDVTKPDGEAVAKPPEESAIG
jgi:hypothetical protein